VSQDVKQFTAGGMLAVNFETFAKVIVNAYQVLAVMQKAF
jgi:hypothetical protein